MSKRIRECMAGKIPASELEPSDIAGFQREIYLISCRILERDPGDNYEHWSAAIDAQPESIRPAVRQELRRVYDFRAKAPKTAPPA